jgi:hypothetical protein
MNKSQEETKWQSKRRGGGWVGAERQPNNRPARVLIKTAFLICRYMINIFKSSPEKHSVMRITGN